MASPTTASTTPTSTQAHQSGATPSTASESMTTTIQALATHMLPVIQRAVDTNLSSLHRTVERLVDEAVTKRTGGPVLDTVVLGSMPSSAALHGLSVSASNSITTSIPQFLGMSTVSSTITQPSILTQPLQQSTPSTSDSILVGPTSPPIPRKIAEKVWRQEFVGMEELLPARLGAAEPTVLDALSGKFKDKLSRSIETIEEWVCSFNTYIILVAQKYPEKVQDLLAYSSRIVNASRSYYGTPWLSYDIHFRRQMAAQKSGSFANLDASIWTLYFGRATSRPVCRDCFQPGHNSCKSASPSSAKVPLKKAQPYQLKLDSDVCRRFNSPARCNVELTFGRPCKFRHICRHCKRSDHSMQACPQLRRSPSAAKP